MDHLSELKQQKQWVNYILYPRSDGSYSKPPIDPHTLKNGSSTDPRQWVDYRSAADQVGKEAVFKPKDAPEYHAPVEGTGIVITGQYCGIDLDHVVKNGKIIAPFAEKLLQKMDTYSELSVSGTGLHLLLYADDLTEDVGGKYHVDGDGNYKKDGEYVVEVYAYPNKTGGRYLTVTEKVFHDRPLVHGKGHMLRQIREYFENVKSRGIETNRANTPPSVGSYNQPGRTDEEVLAMALRYDKDGSFRMLFDGELSLHGGDHSAADQAFVNKLASWTNGNREQMDRIFRNSGLMRPKWDERRGSGTYGSMTIDRALKGFTPYTKPEDRYLSMDEVKQAVAEDIQKKTQPEVNAREASKPEPKHTKKLIQPLTYEKAVEILQNANDESIEIPYFESFAKQAKIGQHDTIVISGVTGGGKSMFALNLMDILNQNHAVLYFNLEMTTEMVLRRMVSIRSLMTLETVEGYKQDTGTAKAVNDALKDITNREPIYVENDLYGVEEIEDAIKQAVAVQESRGRKEPVIVFVDHVLLLRNVGKASSQYERFSRISEELRRIAIHNNCIMFILTQRNRSGSADKDNEPELSSLKESGSFENDATHVLFINKSGLDDQHYLVLRKNRKGQSETKWKLQINWESQTVKLASETSIPLGSVSDIKDLKLPESKNDRPTRKGRKKKGEG